MELWIQFAKLADPIVGLLITIAILGIVWQSAKAVFTRLLDGVEPGVLDETRNERYYNFHQDRQADARTSP